VTWWIVPGVAVLALGFAMMAWDIVVAIASRGRRPRSGLTAMFIQRVGIGLLFLGLGISLMLPALGRGPDLWGLIGGALMAGMGGLYFISVTDPVFRQGKSLMDMSTPRTVPKGMVAPDAETLESKAKRLHDMVHPEDSPRSKAGGERPGGNDLSRKE